MSSSQLYLSSTFNEERVHLTITGNCTQT